MRAKDFNKKELYMALDPRISYSNHILTVEKLAHLVGASAKAGRSESFASSLGCSSKHG